MAGKPPAIISLEEFNESINYQTMHTRISKARGKAAILPCANFNVCGKQATDWAWIHDMPKNDINNYQPMCKSCHITYDYQGRTVSAETRAKIGAAHRGKIVSAESRAKMAMAKLGNQHRKGKRNGSK